MKKNKALILGCVNVLLCIISLLIVCGLCVLPMANVKSNNIGAVSMCTGGFGDLPITAEPARESRSVYLGGEPIGLDMRVGGLIVDGNVPVVTRQGVVHPQKDSDIHKGDIITHIDGVKVDDIAGALKVLDNVTGDGVSVDIMREGSPKRVALPMARDSATGKYRLGLNLVESVEGIGTLTFVDPSNNRFGSLGHLIVDGSTGVAYSNVSGTMHNARIYGVEKGERGRAGQLIGAFDKGRVYGKLDKNSTQGVFGDYCGGTEGRELVEVAHRDEIKHGDAEIVSSVFEGVPTRYKIQIVRTFRQDQEKIKGMMIRVVDDRLIDLSGGIVQGMSGSPILQNGKLIGAVTHVFVSDSTKGYATYIDWMLDK